MTRLDPAFVSSWVMAVIAVAFLGFLGAWAQSSHVPGEPFASEYQASTVENDEPEPDVEAEDAVADISRLPSLRLPIEVYPRTFKLKTEGEEAGAANREHPSDDESALHLIGIEQRDGELLAVVFDSNDTKTHFAKQGDEISGHIIRLIDEEGVTLQIVADGG